MIGMSVLIAEDSQSMRLIIKTTLKRIKSIERVVEATNGNEALQEIAKTRFDLILTDINMPGFDGIKLIKLIKSDERNKNTPVIVISTEGAEEDVKRCQALGACAFLPKPLETSKLLEFVQKLIS